MQRRWEGVQNPKNFVDMAPKQIDVQSPVPPDNIFDVPEEGAQLRILAVEPAPLPLRAALPAQLLQEEAEVRLLREGVPVPQLGYRHRHAVRLGIIE